jgi:hypothetical protein
MTDVDIARPPVKIAQPIFTGGMIQ